MNFFTVCLLFASLVSISLGIIVYRRSVVPGSRFFALLMLSLGIWSAAYGMELNAASLESILFWVRIEYIGIVTLPVFWLAFTAQYTAREKWLTRRSLGLLMVEPVAALLLFWSNDAHELFWADVNLVKIGEMTLASFTHGIAFWLNAAYAYLLLLVGAIFIIKSLLRSRDLLRGQIYSLLVGVLAPWCVNLLYLLGFKPFPYIDLTPFAFTISGIAVTWALLRYRLMEIVPLAQAAIALHNAQLFDAAQQRAHRMTLLNELTRTSLEIDDLQEMLEYLGIKLMELLDADGCWISLIDESDQRGRHETACGTLRDSILDELFDLLEFDPVKTSLHIGHGLVAEEFPLDARPYKDKPQTISTSSLLALPLIAGGQKMGAALVAFNRTNTVVQDEVFLGELAASQIALAIAKIRLLQDERQRADELDALRATVSDISTHLELSRLLQTILEHAVTLLDATGGDLGLYDERSQEILIVVSHKMGRDYSGTHMSLGEGAMGRAIQLNEPVLVTDYHKWEGRSPQYQQGPWYGVLAVPLHIHGLTVGALGIVDANPRRVFSKQDQRLLQLFGQQAAIAIENGQLYTDEKRRAAELEILFQSSAAVTKSLDLPKVYSIATEQLARAVDATSAYILSCDLSNGTATVLTEYFSPNANDQERVSDLGVTYDLTKSPRTLEALGHGNSITTLINDPHIDQDDLEEMLSFGTKSVLKLPMIVSDRLIGYAEIWESRTEQAWSDEEIRLCQTLANQAAVAIENARLYEEMQVLAVTDSLTGIFNRRGFFEAAQRELSRAYRYARPLSAILMDIDHFKQINDIHSHAIGDEVLKTLAQRCRKHLREVDILGRYGGEEFVILLPETGPESAFQLAERLRLELSAEPVMTANGPVEVTLSMGIACTTSEIEALAVLLDRADTAMYAAKDGGRNQVFLSHLVLHS